MPWSKDRFARAKSGAPLIHFVGWAQPPSFDPASHTMIWARDLHFGLHPVTDVIFTETNPAAAKWVLAQAGLIRSGYVRPPLVPLTEAGQAAALALLKQGAPVLEGPVAKVAL